MAAKRKKKIRGNRLAMTNKMWSVIQQWRGDDARTIAFNEKHKSKPKTQLFDKAGDVDLACELLEQRILILQGFADEVPEAEDED